MGHRPGRVRLGGRARQLSERAHLRASGRGPHLPLLARCPAPAREGHPALPLRLLAGDAPGRRLRGPTAALRARLSAARRPQDLEVARQRRRPARPRRPLRRRPRALLVRAVSVVRAGRRGVGRRGSRALRARARERSREPALADHGDGRALSRRRASRGTVVRLRGRSDPGAPRRGRRCAAGRLRPDGGARADLGGRARAQPARRDHRAVATREGRRARGGARPGPLRPRRRAPGRGGRPRLLPPGDLGEDPRGTRAAADARLGWRWPTATHAPWRGSGLRSRSSRGSTSRLRPRDRHARAPRRVRRRCGGAARSRTRGRRDTRRHDRNRDRVVSMPRSRSPPRTRA